MSTTLVSRPASVLQRPAKEAPGRIPAAAAVPRNFQVLQSRSAPAQLCLFLRSGAVDVK